MIANEQCSNLTDEDLVIKTLADQEFYYCLVVRYEQALKRYVSRITNVGDEEVEDILQNVFLKAYLNLNDFDPSLKFSSWLYRIAHNEVVSNHRKRLSRHVGETLPLDDWLGLSSGHSLENELDLTLTREQLAKILSLLDKKYQEVLILKYIEEKD